MGVRLNMKKNAIGKYLVLGMVVLFLVSTISPIYSVNSLENDEKESNFQDTPQQILPHNVQGEDTENPAV